MIYTYYHPEFAHKAEEFYKKEKKQKDILQSFGTDTCKSASESMESNTVEFADCKNIFVRVSLK